MRRARRITIGLASTILLVGAVAQLLLPRLAASRISSRLGRYGSVKSVSVHAWPAIELLWGDADSITVDAVHLHLSPTKAAKLVWEARGADTLTVTARRVQVGPLQLTDVGLHKRGSGLSAQAKMTQTAVSAALPPGVAVQLLSSEGGEVKLLASGRLFGVQASIEAVAAPDEGRLVAQPLGLLLKGFRLTLFSDAHVYVEGVAASRLTGPAGVSGYRLSMSAKLR